MIKYLGSKRTLIEHIQSAATVHDDVQSVFDAFSGTSRVGQALKRQGQYVIANDYNAYASCLARCYVEANADTIAEEAQEWLNRLKETPPKPGYFTETFCEESRYFMPENGAKVDAIRERIEEDNIPEPLRSVLLTSLMEAADRVDSTTGVQMAYLKKWAKRAHNPLELRLPALISGEGKALQGDTNKLALEVESDLAYLDPPYNQHSYLGNYHIWETLVLWDKPEHYGIACKRVECRERKSLYNSKPNMAKTFEDLVHNLRAPELIVSFSNEGFLPRETIERVLRGRGYVTTAVADFKRYVGAQIGIYNPSGERVGKVGNLRNKEFLFFVSPTKSRAEKMLEASGLPPASEQLEFASIR